jgi:AcrR family transcriptional regulator
VPAAKYGTVFKVPGATANRKRSPRRRLPPEVRREQVLDAARRLLDEGGARSLSVEGVAAEAGVSKTVVYSAFGDLDQLVLALVEREEAHALAGLAEAAPDLTGDEDPVETLLAWAAALAETVAAEPERWRLMLIPPPGTPAAVLKRIQRGRDLVVEQLVRVLSSLAPPEEDWDVELAARSIAAAAEEQGRLMARNPADYPPERIVRFLSAVLREITRG